VVLCSLPAALSAGLSVLGAKILYWSLCILPGVPYVLLPVSYRRVLSYKKRTIESFMSKGTIFAAYVNRFGKQGDTQTAVDKLFSLTYHWETYGLAIVLNLGVVVAGMCIALQRGGISLGLPPGLDRLIASAPTTLLLSLGGAYVLSLYDMLKRYRTADLYPASLHFNWLHMIVAGFLGPLLSQAFAPAVGSVVAFGVGIFPLKDSLETAKDYAAKRLQLTAAVAAAERPTLNKLQGLTQDVIDRLEEEGIRSTEHLAYADPIKLLLRTNIPWVVIIDMTDQALLFNYLGEKTAALRSLGIRGSIEVAAIGQRLYGDDPEDQRCARLAITLVAKRLAYTGDDEALTLIRTLWEDGQVDLVWELYTHTETTEEIQATLPREQRDSNSRQEEIEDGNKKKTAQA